MIGRRVKHLAAALTAAITATLAMTAPASADDVLYDTLWYSDDGLTNTSIQTFIGGFGQFGQFRDRQGADNFTIGDSYTITTVWADYTTGTGQAPADGFLVEFFVDDNGVPAEFAAHIALSQDFVMTELAGSGNRRRFAVDISGSGLVLDAGLWWVSIVPVDETPKGTFYSWRGWTAGPNGLSAHTRCGSIAHGTGYSCAISSDWHLNPSPADLAMRIEGMLVGEPKCAPADLDCNGVVNVFDLLDLLAAWGPCDDCPEEECPADLDNNCTVNVFDLLELLGNWGPTCTPDCDGKVCGDDGCGGSCGSCSPGEACQGGQCVCVPDCTGVECGDDGCGGSCGSCPDGEACQSGQCECVPDCTGVECGDDGCGGSCGSCPPDHDCESGQCVCVPDCTGLECGDDGCGGSCGSCPPDHDCESGQCVAIAGCGTAGTGDCFSDNGTPFCDDARCCETVCAADPFCCNTEWDNTCANEAIEWCAADGCGTPGTGDCFSDNGTPFCDDAPCCETVCAVDAFCCNTEWDSICANEAIEWCDAGCTPDCAGKVCGDDGCGGSCGTCPDGQPCENGQCVATAGCGTPGTGDCFSDNGTPFCDDAPCCETVCAVDAFCCNTEWDSICADEAIEWCAAGAAGSD